MQPSKEWLLTWKQDKNMIEIKEIVRCKNCRYYNTTCCSEGLGWCECRNFGIRDEWYCADGEAKTNVDD